MLKLYPGLMLALAVLLMPACAHDSLPSNDALEAAFTQGRSGVWVSGHGTVVRELGAEAGMQRFQVRINSDFNLVIHHRLGAAGRLPAARGDTLAFHGRYEFHGAGGELSLTHADPSQPGSGGWLRHGDIRYD